MATTRIHIVPHEQGWALKREGSNSFESVHATQKAAIDAGRDLAREDEVDIVVHRQDGTFRNVLTYSDEPMSEKANGKKVELQDIASVGSRVSWGAVAAGAAIALALNAVLWMGGLALGITLVDKDISNRTLTTGGAIWMAVSTLFSLFVGGFMVSRLTAGENREEAATYGVILWGLCFVGSVLLASAGAASGTQIASMTPATQSNTWLNDSSYTELNLTREQREKAEALRARTSDAKALSPTAAAWWAFTSLVLSMGAAVGGAWLGAGPEFTLVRFTRRQPVPQPTATP